MPNYTFGGFTLNASSGGLGYFLIGKELPIPVAKPITSIIARRAGAKKSGETVEPRTVAVALKVVGSSRTDLVSRIDTLQAALALRGQALCIHEDGRYYQNVDALSAPLAFKSGSGVVQAEVSIVFLCYDPYAYSSTLSTYDSGTVTLTLSASLWNFPAIVQAGGGTQYSYPLIRLYNRTSTGSTTLTSARNNGTAYTTIAVAATSFSGVSGDQITITHGGTTQTLTVNANFSVGATSITVVSFTAGANYVSSDVAAKVTQWNTLTITQTNDSQTLTGSSSATAPLPALNGDYVDIQCDPAPQNGWTIITNNSGNLTEPIGLFPVLEPGNTTLNIGISCGSAVKAEAVISWLPRWMS